MKYIALKFFHTPFKRLRFILKYKCILWCVPAVVGGYLLSIYKYPMSSMSIIWDVAYLLPMFVWSILLGFSQWVSVYAVWYFFYLRLEGILPIYAFAIKILLFFIVLLVVFPFLLLQLTALPSYGGRFADWNSQYMDIKLVMAYIWIFTYACLLVFYHSSKVHLRKNRLLAIAARQFDKRDEEIINLRYVEDIQHTFMLIRKGDTGHRLKSNGKFVKDSRRAKDIVELLGYAYYEVSKGVNINKRDIVSLDRVKNKVYLDVEKREILRKMLSEHPELKEINDAIKSEHGLLHFSPRMHDKIDEKKT